MTNPKSVTVPAAEGAYTYRMRSCTGSSGAPPVLNQPAAARQRRSARTTPISPVLGRTLARREPPSLRCSAARRATSPGLSSSAPPPCRWRFCCCRCSKASAWQAPTQGLKQYSALCAPPSCSGDVAEASARRRHIACVLTHRLVRPPTSARHRGEREALLKRSTASWASMVAPSPAPRSLWEQVRRAGLPMWLRCELPPSHHLHAAPTCQRPPCHRARHELDEPTTAQLPQIVEGEGCAAARQSTAATLGQMYRLVSRQHFSSSERQGAEAFSSGSLVALQSRSRFRGRSSRPKGGGAVQRRDGSSSASQAGESSISM